MDHAEEDWVRDIGNDHAQHSGAPLGDHALHAARPVAKLLRDAAHVFGGL
jgi:hypothetical protein